MAAILSEAQFQRARAYFYYPENHEVESAWVHKVTSQWVCLLTPEKSAIKPGETVLVHIFGNSADARFLATCSDCKPTSAKINNGGVQIVLLNIVSAPNFRAAVRDARRRVQGVFASLTVAGDTDSVGVEIIDTSYGGIAFLSANELAVSTKGLLALETKKYETEIRITVRNCSQVGSGENNQYRIGATVQALSRLGEALWRNFVDDPMDAPMVEEQAPEQAA